MLRNRALWAACVGALALVAILRFGPRASAADPPDISGDWHLILVAHELELSTTCLWYFEQDAALLWGAMACDDAGAAHLSGGIEKTGAFQFVAEIGGFSWQFSGMLSVMGRYRGLSGYLGPDDTGVSFSGGPARDRYWGDADCDLIVTSLDALLVVQANARFAGPLPDCLWFADVDVSGDVDSLDAILILQLEAGLLDRLPTA